VLALSAAGTAKIDALVPVVYADVDEERFRSPGTRCTPTCSKLAAEGKVTGKTLAGSWSIV
jgi:hypothetical protein